MADRPILFSGPMVRALLDGRKTQTRRTMPDQKLFRDGPAGPEIWTGFMGWQYLAWALDNRGVCGKGVLPRIAIGDRLYVREHWNTDVRNDGISPRDIRATEPVWYIADGVSTRSTDFSVRSSQHRQAMHMPRWASRLTLTVTDVRVERLQDINEADAKAEGVSDEFTDYEIYGQSQPYRFGYSALWNDINGPGAWDENPWVVAYTFTVQRGNIDQIGGAA